MEMELSFRSQVEPSFVIVRIPLSLYLCLSLKFVSLSVKSVMSVICWCRRSYPSPLWACTKACMVHAGLGRVGGGPRSTNHTPQTKHGEQRTAFLDFPGRFPDGLQATGRAFWFHCSRPTTPVQLLPPIAVGCHLPSLPILLVLMLANSARHESQWRSSASPAQDWTVPQCFPDGFPKLPQRFPKVGQSCQPYIC